MKPYGKEELKKMSKGQLIHYIEDTWYKSLLKEPYIESDGWADGTAVWDEWQCPNCNAYYDYDDKHNYCPNCGQHIDWSKIND